MKTTEEKVQKISRDILSSPSFYQHDFIDDIIKIITEALKEEREQAKEEQRKACAEALSDCEEDVSGECIWLEEAIDACMNAKD